MRTTAILILIFGGIALRAGDVTAGSITYTIVNYPSLQNGYTVEGTITTNGAMGDFLPASDISGWSITISGPLGSFDLNTSNSSAFGAFTATPTSMSQDQNEALTIGDFATGNPSIAWAQTTYDAFSPTGVTLWSATSPFTIATVPEPSTGRLALLAAATCLTYGWSRSRRARHRGQPGKAANSTGAVNGPNSHIV